MRRQRDSGRRGGGGSAAPEGGEEAAARLRYIGGEEAATRLRRAEIERRRQCGHGLYMEGREEAVARF